MDTLKAKIELLELEIIKNGNDFMLSLVKEIRKDFSCQFPDFILPKDIKKIRIKDVNWDKISYIQGYGGKGINKKTLLLDSKKKSVLYTKSRFDQFLFRLRRTGFKVKKIGKSFYKVEKPNKKEDK